MPRLLPDQPYVRRVLHYNPWTGVLTWRERTVADFGGNVSTYSAWTAKNAGNEAGSVYEGDAVPYVRLGLLGSLHRAHRIIWLYVYGYIPFKVDHDDGDGVNNRLANLFETDNVGNGRNQKKHVTNTSGHAGVHRHKKMQKWAAYIGVDNKPKWLGAFDTFEEACAARRAAEISLGYHVNHGRR